MRSFGLLPAAFAAPVLLLSSLAHAFLAPDSSASCGSDSACGYGFECVVVGTSGCPPTPPCASDAACPEPEPCTATDVYGCAPAHCQQDADCASGMVCHGWEQPCATTDCACPPGQECDCGAPVSCEPETVSLCTPRYLLPCQTAADCGTGFTCQEAETCTCSGSGGKAPAGSGSGAAPLPPSDGEADPAPTPPDCTCEPSGVKQCVPQEIGCDSDAACPAGWTCEAGDIATTPGCAGPDCPTQPAPTPTPSQCRPPYYGGGGGVGVSTPTAPGSGGGKETPNEGAPTRGDDASEPTSRESNACQFGPPTGGPGAVTLLAVCGALFGMARRRRVR
jgi:hypothetical protein